jgi:hypothetical protein
MERDLSEDLNLEGDIISKSILWKKVWRVCDGLILIRVGPIGGLF